MEDLARALTDYACKKTDIICRARTADDEAEQTLTGIRGKLEQLRDLNKDNRHAQNLLVDIEENIILLMAIHGEDLYKQGLLKGFKICLTAMTKYN